MKAVLTFFFLASVNFCEAQNTQSVSVTSIPLGVQQTLIKAYPALNSTVALRKSIVWKKQGAGFTASFDDKGSPTTALFDPSGLLKSKEVVCSLERLPQAVKQAVSKSGLHFTKYGKVDENGKQLFKAYSSTVHVYGLDGREAGGK